MILLFLKCSLALILTFSCNADYEYSGIIGECEDYEAYKAALDARREKMRQKMLLCNGKKRSGTDRVLISGLKVERDLEGIKDLEGAT